MKTKVRKNGSVIVCLVMFAAVFVVAVTMNVCAQPPTEVWVDDDWAGSNLGDPVDGHTFGVDAFATIQDGIDVVAENGTVNVYDGFYYENVIVAKPVSLNGEITLNGNLTVDDNGNLTLDNVILKMNVTYDGQYHIEVKDGRAMYIQNRCVITDGDGDDDNQRPDSPDNHRFLFWVRKGAKFEMCDSELHECGYEWNEPEFDHVGLTIWADSAVIDNNLITNNLAGIILMCNYTIIRYNTCAYNYDGIGLRNACYNELTCNIMSYNKFEGLWLKESHSNIISYNNASFNTDDGIFLLSNACYNELTHNTMNHNKYYGLQVFCDSNLNKISFNNAAFNKWGFLLGFVSHNLLTNNTGSYNTVNGIFVYGCDSDTVRNNTVYGNSRAGISAGVSSKVTVEENTMTNNYIGLSLGSGCLKNSHTFKNTISDNIFGITIWGQSDNNTLVDNIISNNDYGIIAVTANNNTVDDNIISNNGCGIYLTYQWYYEDEGDTGISKNNTFMNNIITSNYLGIYLDNASINTEIMYNNITENIVSGILCNGSFGTKAKYNNICNNPGYGIKNIDSIIDPFTLVNATYNWWGDPSGPSGVAQGSGDAVSELVDYEYWLTAPVSTERASKEIAIAELKAAKTGDEKIDKALDHILEDLQKSLNKDPMSPDDPWKEYPLWLGYSHLDPQHGHIVFDMEKEAVKKILELLKHEDLPDSVKEACYEVIAKLMEADDDLVKILLDEAKEYAGTSKQVEHHIMLAEQELANAEEALAKGEYDKAIDHYKKAWEHGQLAIYLANK